MTRTFKRAGSFDFAFQHDPLKHSLQSSFFTIAGRSHFIIEAFFLKQSDWLIKLTVTIQTFLSLPPVPFKLQSFPSRWHMFPVFLTSPTSISLSFLSISLKDVPWFLQLSMQYASVFRTFSLFIWKALKVVECSSTLIYDCAIYYSR